MTRTPPTRDLLRPIFSGIYVELWLSVLEARGVPRAAVLQGTGIQAADLADSGRVSPVAITLAIARGMTLTGDASLAYEFGLTMKPTAHGVFGYALMTSATLRDAVLLAQRYLHVRVPRADVRLSVEGEHAAIVLGDSPMPDPIRPFIFEVFIGAIVRAGEMLLGSPLPPVEIWLDYPEPAHFAALRSRLPTVRFEMPYVALHFAAELLGRPLLMADAPAHREAVATLERELAQRGERDAPEAVAARLRAVLEESPGGTLDLGQAARKLRTSERTLKRHLQAEGASFKTISAEVRLDKARALLRDDALTVERVALALGYTDAANFTRAFRKWSGESPRAYRERTRTLHADDVRAPRRDGV